jgi:cytolysin-activating lysine-acyltransferase
MSKNEKNETENLQEERKIDVKPTAYKVPPVIGLESVIGAAAVLAMRSQNHKHLFSGDFEWLIIPPIALKQFRLFRQKKQNAPIAFVSWASVSDEVEKRLLKGVIKLAPKDWNSGKNLWLIDVISPFVNNKEILKQLAESEFKNTDINVLRPRKDKKGFEGKKLQNALKEDEQIES